MFTQRGLDLVYICDNNGCRRVLIIDSEHNPEGKERLLGESPSKLASRDANAMARARHKILDIFDDDLG
jgi:hypothetical protein